MIRILVCEEGGIWYSAAIDAQKRLACCGFSASSMSSAVREVMRRLPRGLEANNETFNTMGTELRQKLHDLYNGVNSGRLRLPPLAFYDISRFCRRVYSLTRMIPRGRVTTYGSLARALGSRSKARAVGRALALNPHPLLTPCHRVVPASLRVGHYSVANARSESHVKREILIREGVKFESGRVLRQCLWSPSRGDAIEA